MTMRTAAVLRIEQRAQEDGRLVEGGCYSIYASPTGSAESFVEYRCDSHDDLGRDGIVACRRPAAGPVPAGRGGRPRRVQDEPRRRVRGPRALRRHDRPHARAAPLCAGRDDRREHGCRREELVLARSAAGRPRGDHRGGLRPGRRPERRHDDDDRAGRELGARPHRRAQRLHAGDDNAVHDRCRRRRARVRARRPEGAGEPRRPDGHRHRADRPPAVRNRRDVERHDADLLQVQLGALHARRGQLRRDRGRNAGGVHARSRRLRRHASAGRDRLEPRRGQRSRARPRPLPSPATRPSTSSLRRSSAPRSSERAWRRRRDI